MGATYTRQSTYADGDTITAAHTNDEFDQLLAAFASSSGHTHDGTAAEGGPITSLLGNTLTFGAATAGTDITITFDGETNDGVLKWMEDEDYFEFSDDILVASTEKLQLRDTGIYLYSSTDGQLDAIADGEVAITSPIVDIDASTGIALDGANLNSTWTVNTTNKIQWRDSGLYINSSTDGQLDIVADSEVQIAATTVDINGNVDVSGTLAVAGVLTGASLDISCDIDIDGTTNLDVVDIDGAVDMASTLTVAGVVDITDTTDSSDATGDTGALRTEGGASIAKKLYVGTDLDVDGTTNLDAVDIDGAVQLDATLTIGANDQGYDVILYGDTASANMTWDTSADDLIFNGAAGLIVPDGQFTLGSTAVSATAAEINLIDGGTSRGTTAVASGDGILINDAGTMRMTNVDTVSTYFAGHSVGGSNIVTTGALNSGSITSGFGSIDIGSSALSTTGSVTLGATSFGDNDITNVGDIALDSISADGTDINVAVSDNSATALTIKQGSDAYLIIDTANSSESVSIGTGISGTAISIGHSTSEVTFGDNVTVTGDFTVNGTTTTVNTANLTITDPLVKYGQGATGTSVDQGFIVTRGDGSSSNTANRGFIWDESADEFATIAANTEAGTTAGNVTINDYAPLHVGAITADDNSTFSGEIAAASLDISGDIDVDGTTNLDAVDIDGAVQLDATLTIGANDQGYDVILYGDTASANMTWDTSADDLIFNGAAGLIVPDGQLTLGSTAISTTAAEINLIDGGTARGTTAVASGDGILINDGGTMRMTNVDTVSTYFSSHNVGGGNIVTTGALNSGSITSGFGAIDNGASNITNGGLVHLDVDADADDVSGDSATGRLSLGAGQDLNLYHGGTNSYIVNDTGNLVINTGASDADIAFSGNDGGSAITAATFDMSEKGAFLIGDLQEQTHGGRISQTVVSGDSVISIMSRSATDSHQPEITFMKTPATSGNYTATADGEALGTIKFRGVNTSAVADIGAQIRAVQNGTESGTVPANLIFSTNETDRLTIAANGTASFSASVVAETDTDTSNTGSVTLNFAEHQNFVLTFTGNVTLANPSTETVGQSGFIACIQDGTGSRTLSLGTDYETAGGSGITLSTTAGATDLVPYVVIAANRILLGAPQLAFS